MFKTPPFLLQNDTDKCVKSGKFQNLKACFFIFLLISFASITAQTQNQIDLTAQFDADMKRIDITQRISYINTSLDTLRVIYLNNWSNSYSTKNTALAKRIAEEYVDDFHLAKNDDRGYSVISAIKQDGRPVVFESLKSATDVVKVVLNKPLLPQGHYTLDLNYQVKIPSDKFTDYGITPTGDINLRYWYIIPAVYDGVAWQYYSNKNLDDLYIPKMNMKLQLTFPSIYFLNSQWNLDSEQELPTGNKIVTLTGVDCTQSKLFLRKKKTFKTTQYKAISLVSDIKKNHIESDEEALITQKVMGFTTRYLGAYPHKKMILSQIDVNKNPIYGLSFLPNFMDPYSKGFEYEMKLLKVTLNNYLENVLLINPRKDAWIHDGILIFYLMKYVSTYYPEMKFWGRISNFWGVRSLHMADMPYNAKYMLTFMAMVRRNKDQSLRTPKDSLLKFNNNISSKYKAGVGLKYLEDFMGGEQLAAYLSEFIKQQRLKPTNTIMLENFLKSKTKKDIDWFFTDYIKTRNKLDFKIKRVSETKDSIKLTIKNKAHSAMPVSLYTLRQDSVISKRWLTGFRDTKTITIPKQDTDRLALNYERIIPEINLRNNSKSLKRFFLSNKPFQIRLIKDIEDPSYNQIFLIPVVEFKNIYDGITLGMRIHNKTLLKKRLNYKITPKYAFRSQSITGSASAFMTHYYSETPRLYSINYGVSGSYASYAPNLFIRRLAPSLSFLFRDNHDLRSNKRNALILRYLSINRDSASAIDVTEATDPNYSVFNMRYVNSNENLINLKKWYADFQLASNFSKLGFNYEYRKLFDNNRQLNLRFFLATFINNKTEADSDYFSFALDRPTDYLFDYNYLGRSEGSGIYSQQYIDAEGGFKSKLKTPFANQWISTMNASTTLWRYILTYGDVGFLKNKNEHPKFVYDAGIRLNLVTDYFEVYFPVYSNLGWEIGQARYGEKIRFKLTLNPRVLLGLFKRRWF